ncbi:MAG: hypothetical protein IPM29_00575 [Planctomycetes bacterium]|nr:hypothetical protein [Planctomycetota bacterium]
MKPRTVRRCEAGLGIAVGGSGNASLPLTASCDPSLFGAALSVQFAVFTPDTDPCGIARVSLSRQLQPVHGD